MISAEDFALLSHWAHGDRIGADVADPDRTATARLADAGYLTPGPVHGMWRVTPAGKIARAESDPDDEVDPAELDELRARVAAVTAANAALRTELADIRADVLRLLLSR
ncbi:hypothetical protein [Kitasatospora sp. NPDC058478]|uniref:hypothetical protein n=1 Tax=unclassified Kitasatospora TaxID=2633591 RepID=UPI003657F78D